MPVQVENKMNENNSIAKFRCGETVRVIAEPEKKFKITNCKNVEDYGYYYWGEGKNYPQYPENLLELAPKVTKKEFKFWKNIYIDNKTRHLVLGSGEYLTESDATWDFNNEYDGRTYLMTTPVYLTVEVEL